MTKHEAIKKAMEAGVLSNKNVVAFDFAGNYRTYEIKDGEIVFEHIASHHLLHWIIAA